MAKKNGKAKRKKQNSVIIKNSSSTALVKRTKNTIYIEDHGPNKSINLNVRGLPLSATLKVNEMSNSLVKKGNSIIKFGLGQSPFPVPETVVQSLRDNAHQKDYLPVKGLPELQEAISEYHRTEDKVYVEPENIMIGPGSKELLFLLQLSFYGEILVASPCWVSYVPQAKIIGRNVKVIRTHFRNRYRIKAELLEKELEKEHDTQKPRLLILNYPDNPTGATYYKKELQKIADVASKYGLMILSDEIYGRIHHEGRHESIAKYYPEGTIVSTGLSKWCGAGGWRLGCFSFPEELKWIMDSMASVASETYTSVSAPIQYAATTAFNGNSEIDEYLVHSRRVLKHIGNYCVKTLKESGNINVLSPDGAFYLFPDFEPIKDQLYSKYGIETSPQMVEKIFQDTGVAILPGENFGRFETELTARLAYVDFNGDAALKASRQENKGLNDEFLNKYAPNVVNGINRIADWAKKMGEE